MNRRFYDAHNHLQDDRFGGRQEDILATCVNTGIVAMVVNGSCESDWPQVLALAQAARKSANLQIIPSFGYHPWYVSERTPDWLQILIRMLDETPSAVGEIGLDRWKSGLPYDEQESVFIAQLRLAAERNLPVSIHCLQAWGRLREILEAEPRPARGFLLHSYGGSREMIMPFAELGAYFSLPGYYAHERKNRQREAFRHVPDDRLLIETDAPDQLLPEEQHLFPQARIHRLTDPASGRPLNHPANLAAVYAFAAELRGMTEDSLSAQVELNFRRLFGDP